MPFRGLKRLSWTYWTPSRTQTVFTMKRSIILSWVLTSRRTTNAFASGIATNIFSTRPRFLMFYASRAISSMQLHLLHSTPTYTPEGDKFLRSFRHAPSGANKIKLIWSFWSAVCISRASLLCWKKEDMSPLEAFGSLADNSTMLVVPELREEFALQLDRSFSFILSLHPHNR